MKLKAAAGVAGLMFLVGAPAHATTVLTFSDGTFVNDTDNQLQPITNERVVDVDTFPFTVLDFDLRLFSVNLPGTYDFSVLRDDFSEVAGLTPVSVGANVSLLSSSNDALFYEYTVGGEAVGDILASFQVRTADVDFRPDDELPDFLVSDTDNDLGIWDPAKQREVVDLDVDLQTVPLPASIFLLAGALGGLGLMRRRKKA